MVNLNEVTILNSVLINLQTTKEKPNFYNPHHHRNVKHPTSNFETFIHFLKVCIGIGVLAMPSAFRNAGYVVGTLGTLITGFICTYTLHLAFQTSYELCKKKKVPSLTYSACVAAAFEEGPQLTRKFAPFAEFIVNFFLVLSLIGSNCVYIVFISTNIKSVVDNHFTNSIDVKMFMIYLIIPITLICCIRNLKFLIPLSSVANCLSLLSFGIIFYYVFRDVPSLSSREPVGTIKNIPLFFGTALFAMVSIGMIFPLENEMKNPEGFCSVFGVINCAMLFITILFTFVGFFGYLKYGETNNGIITLDLPANEVLPQLMKLMLSISIYSCYSLCNHVSIDIIWKHFETKMEKNEYKIWWEYTLRLSLVLLTSVVVPNLEYLISFIGAFCSTMGIALPAIINLLTFLDVYRKQGCLRLSLFILRNFLIVLIAIFAFIIGVSTCIKNIIAIQE
ncbi:proton-coupled amino acid transporter-like protein CG1139 isoform X2 [Daktulosphaira vitifoliae]|uniref:proton-coupled amino acid transporter-like protein CG1139 isoform X2 n=1 Tax=Daktulosphaira vitifoliae TaxID=58002 RepID=UPI0021AA381C|nr:proton-coupled amino acid transporter-like protein CG1139 isoform X2 [Daktulosphaira vitifoliae]